MQVGRWNLSVTLSLVLQVAPFLSALGDLFGFGRRFALLARSGLGAGSCLPD